MHPLQHAILIFFLFALGASVGSFLNVVVWRLPRGKSLVKPASHCPKCQHPLAWYDNIPVFGWIFLRGRCRYCGQPISARYPIIEFITGSLFVFYYVMFFLLHISPCAPMEQVVWDNLANAHRAYPRLMTSIFNDWPIFTLELFLVASLLAISLIDAELYIIPLSIPWLMALVGGLVHTFTDAPDVPGAIMVTNPYGISGALAAGGLLGLILSLWLYRAGRICQAFPEGEPALEVDLKEEDEVPALGWLGRLFERFLTWFRGQPSAKQEAYWKSILPDWEARQRAEAKEQKEAMEHFKSRTYTKKEIRAEIRKEITFLLPPMILGLVFVALTQLVPFLREWWQWSLQYYWFTGLLGSILGALVGALVVWIARIFGTLAFGRVAMGLGDVHLMFGAGAIVGAGASTVAFFLAPFAGVMVGIYALVTRKKHELPYGPYLSLATAAVLLFYCPIADYLAPGMQGIAAAVRQLISR